MARFRYKNRWFFVAFFGIAAIAYVVSVTTKVSLWSFGLGVLIGATMTAGFTWWDFIPRDATSWQLGAEGEKSTAARVQTMESVGWFAVHDRAITRGNVDHVLIGPGGVYALDTKNWDASVEIVDGVVKKNGFAQPNLTRSAKRIAREINSVIKTTTPTNCWVEPVIVFWADFPQNYVFADGVHHVAGETLTAWLYSREMVLNTDRIAMLRQAIESMPDGITLGAHNADKPDSRQRSAPQDKPLA